MLVMGMFTLPSMAQNITSNSDTAAAFSADFSGRVQSYTKATAAAVDTIVLAASPIDGSMVQGGSPPAAPPASPGSGSGARRQRLLSVKEIGGMARRWLLPEGSLGAASAAHRGGSSGRALQQQQQSPGASPGAVGSADAGAGVPAPPGVALGPPGTPGLSPMDVGTTPSLNVHFRLQFPVNTTDNAVYATILK